MCNLISITAPHRDLIWSLATLRVTAILMLSGLAIALLPCISSAAVFKCNDHGQVVYSGTKCAEDAEVLSSKSEPLIEQHGSLTLYLNSHRNYSVDGTINNHPVNFIVDTGASATTISLRTAIASGIRYCTGMGFTGTANGTVRNCIVTVSEFSFGMFHMNNVTVNILPTLSVDALLGMDVLRKMKIQQQGDAMIISN